ncbi:MAG: superinfection immunity protein, partial [Proteobacteria bacterium]|nr:superinfection immunity protein [Pseudomonadota bacterium]
MEFMILVLWVAYLAPFIVAVGRDHPRPARILTATLLLGWTGIGWAACLVCAWRAGAPWRRRPRLRLVRAPEDEPPGPWAAVLRAGALALLAAV